MELNHPWAGLVGCPSKNLSFGFVLPGRLDDWRPSPEWSRRGWGVTVDLRRIERCAGELASRSSPGSTRTTDTAAGDGRMTGSNHPKLLQASDLITRLVNRLAVLNSLLLSVGVDELPACCEVRQVNLPNAGQSGHRARRANARRLVQRSVRSHKLWIPDPRMAPAPDAAAT